MSLKFCGNCSQALIVNQKFCPECGTDTKKGFYFECENGHIQDISVNSFCSECGTKVDFVSFAKHKKNKLEEIEGRDET